MTLFGNKTIFAIECELSRAFTNPIYIHFRFWAGGENIGNYEDEIFLSTCISYLKEFMEFAGQRFEPELEGQSKEDIFRLIFDSVVFTVPPGMNISEFICGGASFEENPMPRYKNIEKRFHLDAVGVSSFDKFNIILVETLSGEERLIWRTLSDMELHEIVIPLKGFETVAKQFTSWVDEQKY
jgi:hypothetical protein